MNIDGIGLLWGWGGGIYVSSVQPGTLRENFPCEYETSYVLPWNRVLKYFVGTVSMSSDDLWKSYSFSA